LDHLLALGIGDRERQAVMGHSFGGYLSLLAVSHHPTRFAFAYAGAAPTDYGWTKQWQAENESDGLRGVGVPVALSFQHHGLPFTDAAWREKMRRESPLAAIPRLRTPIYLWAGAHDDRVPIKSLTHYASEVRRGGRAVGLLIDPDAGHSPRSARSEEAWVYLMERAAHRHFGGGLTPASPELEGFLRQSVRIDTERALIAAPR
jgi:dipeptidyl aminopeptidase/acylaminoacyl peptidase